jgi:RHS repeat-associated protein
VYYYLNDHLGTPQLMVDSAGTVVWEAKYKPFGEAEVSSKVVNNFRFPGQYYDQETGLHYNWHRDYDPGTGRYLTPDPLGLAGGLNLFPYVDNNPLNIHDPSGLQWSPGPLVTPPAANPDQRAPGAANPPPGSRVPFVGDTMDELGNYANRWYGLAGYNRFSADYLRLKYDKALDVPCGKTADCALLFKVEDRGIHLFAISCPGDRMWLPSSAQRVPVEISGACCHGAGERPGQFPPGPSWRPMY